MTTPAELLSRVSTATLAGLLSKRGFQHQFMVGMRRFGGVPRCAGPAFTLRLVPARADLRNGDRFQQALEVVPPGHVLVIDSMGDGRAGSIGDLLATRLAVRGVAGLVTDGAVRDSAGLAAVDIAIHAPLVSANLRSAHFYVAGLQEPIACGGVTVVPGDIVVTDDDGPIVVPEALACELATEAAEQERLETYVGTRLRSGEPLAGVYPPGDAVLADYEAWKAAR